MRRFLSLKYFVILLFAVVAVGTIYAFVSSPSSPTSPRIIQQSVIRLPIQTTTPGVTKESEIARRENILSKVPYGERSTEYRLESGVYLNPNRVVVQNEVVEYESIVPDPDNYSIEDYPKISDVFSEYGDPEIVYQGSANFGPFARTYVYASRGFAFVGKPATDDVLQYQFFKPSSIALYQEKFTKGFTTPENHPVEQL